MLRKLLDGGIRCASARAAESISKRARSTVRDDLARLHAGPPRSSQKTYRIEKIRFLKPDVAVVQASSHSINGDNIGTFVLEKQKGHWLTVSFTKVAPHDRRGKSESLEEMLHMTYIRRTRSTHPLPRVVARQS